MATPIDNTAIQRWADDQGIERKVEVPRHSRTGTGVGGAVGIASVRIQPTKANWLVKLLGWEPKLIVVTDQDNKRLEYRSLKWGEWFDAVRGKLEGVTLPAIAKHCKENNLNTAKLQELYKHYIELGVGQIEANHPHAKKVDRAAALLKSVDPAAVQWEALSQIHPKASAELLKRADVSERVKYATLLLVENMGIENLGILGSVSKELILEKAKTEPAVALKLALYHAQNDAVEELCTPDLLKKLLAAKVQFTAKELSGLMWAFRNAAGETDKVEAARIQVNIASIYLRCAPRELISEAFRKEVSDLHTRILQLGVDQPGVKELANDNLNLVRDLLRLNRSPRNQA